MELDGFPLHSCLQPKSTKQLRGFVGMVNYYRDMWPHRAHILAPLTAKTGIPKKGEKISSFQWTTEMQQAFEQMKTLMTADVLCAYPNHNKPFEIYTDASDYQYPQLRRAPRELPESSQRSQGAIVSLHTYSYSYIQKFFVVGAVAIVTLFGFDHIATCLAYMQCLVT